MLARVLGLLCWVGVVTMGPALAQPDAPNPADRDADTWKPTTKLAQDKPAPAPVAIDPKVRKANAWTLGLATGLPEGTFMRVGAEIARHLNDGDRLRIMPMITNGATGNVLDLMYLKGVDVALTNADVLEHFRTAKSIPGIERRLRYIAGMYITHLHVLVRPDIASLADLAGRKVSFHTRGAGTSVSAPILFKRLGIAVEPVYVNNAIAMEMMKTGDLAGLVNSGAKPVGLLTRFKNDYGFKLLSIPFEKFGDLYVPSVLTSRDYPGYIPPGEKVATLGIPVVLAVYNWPPGTDRARRIARFIDRFFDRFEGFQRPPYHPLWKSINLAAKVPGWVRYRTAEEKLARMGAGAPEARSRRRAAAGRGQAP